MFKEKQTPSPIRSLRRLILALTLSLLAIAAFAQEELQNIDPQREKASSQEEAVQDARAQQIAPDMFIEVAPDLDSPTITSLRAEHGVDNVMLVRLNAAALTAGDDVPVALKASRTVRLTGVTRVRTETLEQGRYYWYGKLSGAGVVPDGSVSLVVDGANVLGVISSPEGDTYRIMPVGNNVNAIIKSDYAKRASSKCSSDIPYGSGDLGTDALLPNIAKADGGIPTINVLFVYTPSARKAREKEGGLSLLFGLATGQTNDSFRNSGINANLQNAGERELNYTESNNWSQMLNDVATNPSVAQWRDQTDADIVVFLINEPPPDKYQPKTQCGLAKAINANSSEAFVIVDHVCEDDYLNAGNLYVVAHEIGHLLGALHDTETSPQTTPYVYGHGHLQRKQSGGWHTIMAYSCKDGGCPQTVPYWSNPSVSHLGDATGNAATENNARVWNERAAAVAAFRPKKNPHTVTFNPGVGMFTLGEFSATTFGSEKQIVLNDGEKQIFGVVSYPGEKIYNVKGCDSEWIDSFSINGGTFTLLGRRYITGAITKDCTVTASFLPESTRTHTVTALAGNNGEIISSRQVNVVDGRPVVFQLKPDPGYIANIWPDSSSNCPTGRFNSSRDEYTTGNITESCVVFLSFSRVSTPTPTYTVTASISSGSGKIEGGIAPVSRTVDERGSTSFTVTPDAGYSVSGVGGDCNVKSYSGDKLNVSNVTKTCSVTVSFVLQPPGSPSDVKVYSMNSDFTSSDVLLLVDRSAYFKVTGKNLPDALAFGLGGCVVQVISRTSTEARFQCTPKVPGNQQVLVKKATGEPESSALFNQFWYVDASYTVKTSADAGGKIDPPSTTVNYDNNGKTFTVTPNSASYISSISGCDGQAVTGNSTYTTARNYTTGKIIDNCTVTATFGATTFEVTGKVVNGVGGTISPSTQQVKKGSSANLTVARNPDYSVGNIFSSCGGEPNGKTTTTNAYTTKPITGPCSVTATFVLTNSMPVVTDVVPTDSTYTNVVGVNINQPAHFKVTGLRFNALLAFALDDCELMEGGKVSDTEAHFQCIPRAGGFKQVTVKTATNDDGGIPLPLPEPLNSIGIYVNDLFAPSPTVTASVKSGSGSINPVGKVTVFPGNTKTFTVQPNNPADSVSIGGTCPKGILNSYTNEYTTGRIYADCTVEVSFAPPTPVTHITGVTSTDSSFSTGKMPRVDEIAYFKVTGSNLPDSLFLRVDGCEPTLGATRTFFSPSEAHFQCVPRSSGTTSYWVYSQTDLLHSASLFIAIALEPTYTVTAVAGVGGTIDPSKFTSVFYGKAVSFTVTPNTGYVISSVSGCGNGSLVVDRYTTGTITGDCTVTASFVPISGISVISTDSSFSNSGVTPKVDQMAYFKVTGNNLPSTLALGVDDCVDMTRTFINASEARFQCTPIVLGGTKSVNVRDKMGGQTIYSTSIFVNATYKVTAQAGSGGTISPSSVDVDHGKTATFTVTPGAGNSIGYVTAGSDCSGGVLTGNTYTTGAVVGNCLITAAFVATTAKVTSVISTDSSFTAAAEPSVSKIGYFKITGSDFPAGLSMQVGGCFYDQTSMVVVSATEAHFTCMFHSAGTQDFKVTTQFGGGYTLYSGSVSVHATYTVSTLVVSGNGTITPSSAEVSHDGQAKFTVTPGAGYSVSFAKSSCGDDGTLSGTTFTLNNVKVENCVVSVSFVMPSTQTYTVSPYRSACEIYPDARWNVPVNAGATAVLKITSTQASLDAVGGTCGGTLSGDIYTTKPVTANCYVEPSCTRIFVTKVVSTNSSFTDSGVTPRVGQMAYFKVTGSDLPNTLDLSVEDCTGMVRTFINSDEVRFQCTPSGSGGTKAILVRKVVSRSLYSGSIFVDGASAHAVTVSAGTGGTISPSGNVAVNDGDTRMFTVTPNAGYSVSSVGGTCGGTFSGNTYTTKAITADCTVTATFAQMAYTVTTGAGAGGAISPSGDATVNHGETRTFTITPDAGYSISSINGCSGSLSGNTYTTGAITVNCAVTAMFAAPAQATLYTVTASAGTGGTINPSGDALVGYGATMMYIVTPDAGYSIYSVGGTCGGMFGSGNTYITDAITDNCTVTATFVASVAAELTFVNAVSRKVHGAAGTFDLPISATGSLTPGSAITVEPRSGGANQAFDLVFQFSGSVTSASATLTGAGSATTTVNGTEVTVHLTNVPDKIRLGVTLTVNGVANAASANIGFLLGDVSGNRFVQAGDLTAISARAGQVLNATNFIYDVNTNGNIQASDVTAVSARAGNSLP